MLTPTSSFELGGPGEQAPFGLVALGDETAIAGVYTEQFDADAVVLPPALALDGFVARVDGLGQPRWAAALSGPGDDAIYDLAADEQGGLIVAGQFSPGAALLGRVFDTPAPSSALLARLDADGALDWALTSGRSGFQSIVSVKVAGDGALYFAGNFTRELDLGSSIVSATGGGDLFVARCSAQGTVEWLRVLSGAGIQSASELSVTPDGGVVLVGTYDEELTAETDRHEASPMLHATPFAAKFAAAGEREWLSTDLVPDTLQHHSHDHGHGDFAFETSALRVTTTAGGRIVTALSYGQPFAMHSQDFEAAAVSSVALTWFDTSGTRLTGFEIGGPGSLIQLGALLSSGSGVELAMSWTGRIELAGEPLTSDNRRSLLQVALDDGGRLLRSGRFGVDGSGLTSMAATKLGSDTAVAARLTHLTSGDYETFVARFATSLAEPADIDALRFPPVKPGQP